jgi:glycosyltransferase involved in cell wall biosynthesis
MKILWFNLRVDRNRQGLAFAIDWLNSVAEQVERIDVITMQSGEYQVRDNVHIYSIGKEKGYSEPRRAIEFYRLLWNLVSQHDYDACFAHMMPLFAVMAAPVLRVKHVPMVLWYTHKSVTVILRLAAMLVDRIVTASKESFRIESRKVRIIGHGIDTERFALREYENGSLQDETSERPFTVLTVGRLSRIKRIELLLEAVDMFRQEYDDAPLCLKIAGGPLTEKDQSYVAELKQYVEEHQLQDSVMFVGSVPFEDMVAYYQEADCFVSLSNTGSIDKVVLEAMSCGVPVIVTPIFAGVLGPELAETCTVDWDVGQLCHRLHMITTISTTERERLGEQLRAIVVRDHALPQL